MTRDRLLLIGLRGSDYKWAIDTLPGRLEDAGFEDMKQYHHPKVSVPDLRRAVKNRDLDRKKASWVRDVPERKLHPVIERAEGLSPSVVMWGFSVTVPADWNALSDVIDGLPDMESEVVVLSPSEADPHTPPDMEYQPDAPKNPNAPFSYDPERDYYTEPDQ